METIEQLINSFNIAKKNNVTSDSLNSLAEEIQKETLKVYFDNTPFLLRRNDFSDFEKQKWNRLLNYITTSDNICLFDSAFGSGRDLLIAKAQGYDVYGCELSKFLYEDFLLLNEIDKNHLICCDMRSIPFNNEMFDVVRHNASFLHMPIIGKGYTVHACLEESNRILKQNGILYICIKEGKGFVSIDTLDGLGKRPFQLFDENLLSKILFECGFELIDIFHYEKIRNGKKICWLESFAKKI